jgi:hypothetical protein
MQVEVRLLRRDHPAIGRDQRFARRWPLLTALWISLLRLTSAKAARSRAWDRRALSLFLKASDTQF